MGPGRSDRFSSPEKGWHRVFRGGNQCQVLLSPWHFPVQPEAVWGEVGTDLLSLSAAFPATGSSPDATSCSGALALPQGELKGCLTPKINL